MTDSTTPRLDDDALMDALWSLVAEHGWQGTSLPDLAERAGIDLPTLRGAVPTKFDLLCRHARLVDQAVLADAGLNPGGSPRDRLFDTLMRRIDALQPHRAGLVRFGRDLQHDPLLALALAPVLGASMAWMLEAARIESCGLLGALRAQGLGAAWISTLRTWEQDDSVDLGLTMAALDKALDKAERAARWLRLDRDETAAPEASMPEGPMPEEPVSEAAMGEAAMAAAVVPEDALPETTGRETTAPETTAPETALPDVPPPAAPDSTAPEPAGEAPAPPRPAEARPATPGPAGSGAKPADPAPPPAAAPASPDPID